METRCRNEINELHQFFQDWFTGELSATDENFERVIGVLHENFTIISPDGSLMKRVPLLALLREGHGTRQDFRIWIEDFRLHHYDGDLGLATYQEWQKSPEGTTVRLSTALFLENEGSPNRLAWLHVHETWLALPAES